MSLIHFNSKQPLLFRLKNKRGYIMTIESFGGEGDYVNIVGLNEKIVSNIRDLEKMTLSLIN